MRRAKLAAGSLLTTADQLRLYEEQMGVEAANRQIELANRQAKRCTCKPHTVKRRWEEGEKKSTIRTVHDPSCIKWKPWMAAAQEAKQ